MAGRDSPESARSVDLHPLLASAAATTRQLLAFEADLPLPGLPPGMAQGASRSALAASAASADLARVSLAIRDLAQGIARLSVFLDQLRQIAADTPGRDCLDEEVAGADTILSDERCRLAMLIDRAEDFCRTARSVIDGG